MNNAIRRFVVNAAGGARQRASGPAGAVHPIPQAHERLKLAAQLGFGVAVVRGAGGWRSMRRSVTPTCCQDGLGTRETERRIKLVEQRFTVYKAGDAAFLLKNLTHPTQ